jgi:flavin-dependent dehydrogenase
MAADGANSTVCRRLGFVHRSTIGVASEIHIVQTGEALTSSDKAVFDFTSAGPMLQGYYWNFPATQPERQAVGLAIAQVIQQTQQRPQIPRLLGDYTSQSRTVGVIRSAPLRVFSPATPSQAPNVIFVGDALGCDALFDEGIGTAIETGILGPEQVVSALNADDLSLSRYAAAIDTSGTGRFLDQRLRLARAFYRDPQGWQLAVAGLVSRRLDRIPRHSGRVAPQR